MFQANDVIRCPLDPDAVADIILVGEVDDSPSEHSSVDGFAEAVTTGGATQSPLTWSTTCGGLHSGALCIETGTVALSDRGGVPLSVTVKLYTMVDD